MHVGAADAGQFYFDQRSARFDRFRYGKLFKFEWRFVVCQYGSTRRLQLILPLANLHLSGQARRYTTESWDATKTRSWKLGTAGVLQENTIGKPVFTDSGSRAMISRGFCYLLGIIFGFESNRLAPPALMSLRPVVGRLRLFHPD